MRACYLELYEEHEVEHINDAWSNSMLLKFAGVIHTVNSMSMHEKIPVNT